MMRQSNNSSDSASSSWFRVRWYKSAGLFVILGAIAVAAVVTVGVTTRASSARDVMQVHEWGTFTTLQDEFGRELPGVNVDDEPVPRFVHNLSPYIVSPPLLTSEHWRFRQKAAPRRHPLVTMRLETPVIYFYPPEGQREPKRVDVKVAFHGGWLTEFFPRAVAGAPGLKAGQFRFGHLSPDTVGTLQWNDLLVGTDGQGPETDEHVWIAPRRVRAVPVTSAEGESERYLFYRGVGNLHAPLSVSTDLRTNELAVRANFQEVLGPSEEDRIAAAWLTHIREDGSVAFRRLPSMTVTSSRQPTVVRASGSFEDEEFSVENMSRLRGQMHAALVAEGLFADEAEAMLATWQRAYFQNAGLRLFFTVPRSWTDHYLPLTLSAPADVERVMMGRIELVSRRQRKLLKELAKSEISNGSWLNKIPAQHAEQKARLLSGRSDFGDLGLEIPVDFRIYLDLGRFRNALVTAEERRRPTQSLSHFINHYGLHPYRW